MFEKSEEHKKMMADVKEYRQETAEREKTKIAVIFSETENYELKLSGKKMRFYLDMVNLNTVPCSSSFEYKTRSEFKEQFNAIKEKYPDAVISSKRAEFFKEEHVEDLQGYELNVIGKFNVKSAAKAPARKRNAIMMDAFRRPPFLGR